MNLLDRMSLNRMSYDSGGYTVQEILSSFSKKILEIIDLVNKNEEVCNEAHAILENIRNELVPPLVDDIMKELQDNGFFDSLVNVTLYEQLRTELTTLLNQTITDYSSRLDNFETQLGNIEILKADKENITELINVLSLGFDNTGNDDITEKLQNIFDTKNNITLYFPSGQYRINGNLTVGDNKNFKLIGENYRTVKFNCYANDGKVFNMSASSLTNEIHETFEDISFINSGTSQT